MTNLLTPQPPQVCNLKNIKYIEVFLEIQCFQCKIKKMPQIVSIAKNPANKHMKISMNQSEPVQKTWFCCENPGKNLEKFLGSRKHFQGIRDWWRLVFLLGFLIKHFIREEHGERKKGKHTIEPSIPTSFTFDTFSKILAKFLGFWCFISFLGASAQEGKRKGGQNGTLHQAQKNT